MKNRNWTFFSLGGSLVFPDKIDVAFLKKFSDLIFKWLQKNKKFVIFVGGGKLARNFQKEAKKLKVQDQYLLDWLGIYATYLNAFLLKSIFGKLAYKEIIINPTKKIKTNKKIIIGTGWKPGRSTDFDSVILAKKMGIKQVINLTDVDYVFNKDPDKFKNAKAFRGLSFSDFLKLGLQKWEAGLSFPFDPIATRLAKKEKIKIIIANGRNLNNLNKILKGRKFVGTTVF